LLETFYYQSIRKYVIVFGTLFNDIYVNRQDANGENVQSIKVPLSYSPKEKMLARMNADPNLDRPFAMVMPKMGFEILNISYDGERKLNTVHKMASKADPNNNDSHLYQYSAVPYNIDFALYVTAKNAEDGTRILEQILPYFTPDWNVTVNLIPELSIKRDIPIVFTGLTVNDLYEGDFMTRRTMIWSLNFTLMGWLFGPTKKQNLIKTSIAKMFIPNGETIDDAIGNTVVSETITVTPGLDANGAPTSNSSISVGIDNINKDNDYGFIVEFDRGL
jgi:hypothetical protein